MHLEFYYCGLMNNTLEVGSSGNRHLARVRFGGGRDRSVVGVLRDCRLSVGRFLLYTL